MDGSFAPGSRVVVRDAEWLVRRVDRTSTGGNALSVVGISELVRDKEAVFLTEIENDLGNNIEVLRPEHTQLVPDTSSAYQASLLYMESLLRRKAPTDDRLYIGHQASMDPVPFQLDPTAIVDPDHYGPEDIKGLFIRRFKKDIQHQVEAAFRPRKISVARCKASVEEDSAFEVFSDMTFTRLEIQKVPK
jgi:hypothetical protein